MYKHTRRLLSWTLLCCSLLANTNFSTSFFLIFPRYPMKPRRLSFSTFVPKTAYTTRLNLIRWYWQNSCTMCTELMMCTTYLYTNIMAVSINCFTFQYSPSELHVKSGPENNVQSLMHYHLATVRRRIALFASINQSINIESAYTETWPALYK